MCRLSWNLGASTSWNPLGLSRPVMELLYLYLYLTSNLMKVYPVVADLFHVDGQTWWSYLSLFGVLQTRPKCIYWVCTEDAFLIWNVKMRDFVKICTEIPVYVKYNFLTARWRSYRFAQPVETFPAFCDSQCSSSVSRRSIQSSQSTARIIQFISAH